MLNFNVQDGHSDNEIRNYNNFSTDYDRFTQVLTESTLFHKYEVISIVVVKIVYHRVVSERKHLQ